MKNIILEQKRARVVINETFSVRTKSVLNQAILESYKNLNQWLKDDINQFISVHEKEARGRVLNWMVDYFTMQLVDRNAIDFSCFYEYTDISGLPFLVLKSKNENAEFTINQVKSRSSVARPSKERTNKIGPYQTYLDLFEEDTQRIEVSERPLYFQLTHGYQSETPSFTVLGIPGDGNQWVGSIDISKEIQVLQNEPSFKSEQFKFESPMFSELEKVIKLEGD